jgi:hypothetical protein
LTLFIRLFKGSSKALQDVHFSRVHSSLPVDPLDMTAAPHPRFPVQGRILALVEILILIHKDPLFRLPQDRRK